MKNFIKKTMVILALMLSVTPMLTTASVVAAPKDDACAGIRAAGGSCTGGTAAFGRIVRSIISVLSIVVGAVSVVMIIVGGFRYVVSNGDTNATAGAKNTILYALVGLLVVVFAQVIVRFVMTNV